MEISETELRIISSYSASELAGALIVGKAARLTKDPELRARLTLQCAEESRHAALWIETILAVGGQPAEVHDTSRSHYYARAGEFKSEIELLAFIESFEKIVPFHLSKHLARPGIHPKVQETLLAIISDESGHLSWVSRKLDAMHKGESAHEVESARKKFSQITREVYENEVSRMRQAGGELAEFAEILMKVFEQAFR